MALSDRTEKLITDFTDKNLYREDPYYHAQCAMFRQWLIRTREALRDEVVDEDVIECVINRLVYGHPQGSDAYERIETRKQQIDFLMKNPGSLVFPSGVTPHDV